jgi:hypothetical protein
VTVRVAVNPIDVICDSPYALRVCVGSLAAVELYC